MNTRFVEKLGGPAIVFTNGALSTMMRYKQIRHNSLEGGGQLFGKFDDFDAIVIEATPPKFLDKRSRYGFEPNRFLQKREIRNRYCKGLHYLGDWHTHPEKRPVPSIKDILNMKECYRQSIHDLKAFVMVIVGTDIFPSGLNVSLVKKDHIVCLICEDL